MRKKSGSGGRAIDRRRFIRAGAAGALTAASWQRVMGANERIGIGFIGYGLIGQMHVEDFREKPDAAMVAMAEAHAGRLEQGAQAMGGTVAKYRDFRKMLENKDVDAVVVSTPDHWHALMTMLACAAGKDVYVEKPTTLFVREGRWMVDVARRFKRVVQVGTQQRSGPHYQRAHRFIREGRLGKIVSVGAEFHRNIYPGFGRPPDEAPPPELDWDMFLGPAPEVKYNRNRGIYQFRWFWDYSGGQITNWGQHSLDIVHWVLDTKGPARVYSTGGRLFLQDNCETPDVQDAILEYEGNGQPPWTFVSTTRECCLGESRKPLTFYGTNGSLSITRGQLTVWPDLEIPAINVMPGVLDGHPAGGPQPLPQHKPPRFRTDAVDEEYLQERDLLKLHARNFLDCIKSREEPNSDLESGHRVATALHLANLSLRLGRRLQWDAEKEAVIGDREAMAMLERPYRKPWDAELRALKVT